MSPDVRLLGLLHGSRKEPGIAQFDLLQQADDPSRFVLLEAYRSADAPAAHKAFDLGSWRNY